MKELKKTLRWAVAGILLCVMLTGGGYLLGNRAGRDNQEVSLDAVMLQNQITSMSELATVTYTYTELGQYESSKEFYGVKMPLTTNKFILTYDGIIKAGVDMSQVYLRINDRTVTVMLPAAEILSHEIDEESVKIFDEKTSIFNAFTVKDYTEFYADQKKSVEAKALSKGLLEEAGHQAETAVRQLLYPVLDAANRELTGDAGDETPATGEAEKLWNLEFQKFNVTE